MNKLLIIIVFLFFLFGCSEKKKDIEIILTNDSISMWDIRRCDKVEINGVAYPHCYMESISFNINGICELYKKRILNDRKIIILGPKPNYLGLCNKWEILNDSTIKLNCRDVFVVKVISRDTLHLIDTLGIKQHEMYRVQPPWNIDEESVKLRDKEVKSGKYLENNMDGEMFRDAPIGNNRKPPPMY